MRFFGQVVKKKGTFGPPPPQKRTFWLITEKPSFGNLGFFFFSFFLLSFSIFSFFPFCPFFIFSTFVLFIFCFFVLVFSGGFKGQVRWPEGPPHLAPKPSLSVLLCFCFSFCFWGFLDLVLFFLCFPFLLLEDKNLLFRLKKPFVFIFSVSLCFSLAFCLTSPFHSLSLYLLFLSFFFLFCFLLLAYFCLFVSLPCFFASVSWKEQHQYIKLENLFFFNSFCLGGLLSCFLFRIPCSYLCFSLMLSCVSCSTSQSFSFKKTLIVGQDSREALQQNTFLNNLCFAKCKKILFLAIFAKIWFMFKKHCKTRYSQHILKSKKRKTKTFWDVITGSR